MKPVEQRYIHIAALIRKQFHAPLSDTEQKALDSWIDQSTENRDLYSQCLSAAGRELAFQELESYHTQEAYARIKTKINHLHRPQTSGKPPVSTRRHHGHWRKWLPYAAAVVVIASTLTWIFLRENATHLPREKESTHFVDFAPAGNRATIQLSDGRLFNLKEENNRVIVNANGVTYPSGESVAHTESARYATMTTPRGGTYHLVLADGTEVTLNAGSTLTYPTSFSGNERVVKLRGEAYFDVSREDRPFRVETRSHTVEVLGTQFNLSAYDDETWAKTTLIAGSVILKLPDQAAEQTLTLTPGNHGVVIGNKMVSEPANIPSDLAWIRGRFDFDGKRLREVLREISRWYDVDVVYEDDVPDIEFFGGTFRNGSLTTILDLLESSGLHYRLETDRRVVIGSETGS